MIDIIAIATLLIVGILGILIKRYTRRALSDLDGLGSVTKQDDDSVAKF